MAKSKQLPGQLDMFDTIGIAPQNDSKRRVKMINWTEEDINYIAENMIKPVIQQIAQEVASAEEAQNELTNRMFSAVGDAIADIRYEMMRDRRFFLGFVAEYAHLNKEALYEGHKKWCDEFDKLNKEKNDD